MRCNATEARHADYPGNRKVFIAISGVQKSRRRAAKKGWETRRKKQVQRGLIKTGLSLIPGVGTAINAAETIKDASKLKKKKRGH